MAESKPPFLAFVTGSADVSALKAFAATHGWSNSLIHEGDIKNATSYLKSSPSPSLLMVEIASVDTASALLDQLAEVCDPNTKVIVTGTINEYSFYVWLTEIGIFNYLLKPLTALSLESIYLKSQSSGKEQPRQAKHPGKVITVLGSRGGAGATTIAINLAGIIADSAKKNTVLVDLDPHEGGVALTLDLDPSRGLREAMEKPERIDSVFLERVMSKPFPNLSIISAEESLAERVLIHDQAISVLLASLKETFDIVILDLPNPSAAYARHALALSDHVILVSELTLPGLRDTLRITDLMRETLKLKAPLVVANRVGMSKHQLPIGDFEKGLATKIEHRIAFNPDLFMPPSTTIPAVKSKTHTAIQPLKSLAEFFVPEATEAEKTHHSLFDAFKKKS